MKIPNPIILAIESSCDDTSAAVLINGEIVSNVIASQKIHEEFGGVVPEMASRAHLQNIVPVVDTALKKANVTMKDLNAIACTQAPGLLGSLLVGMNFSKALSQSLQIPFIGVHHMQAHIMAHWAEDPKPTFPFLCLTISGGHTQIVKCNDFLDFEIVGTTIDDAAGEAFDKAAKMLGLPYPGGPLIDKLSKVGNPDKFKFAIPNISNFDFSFSGLKTSILYFLQKNTKQNKNFIEENLADLCASIQNSIVSILMKKFIKAAEFYKIKNLGIAGGVSANSEIRNRLTSLADYNTYIPDFQFCTDNAGMVAITAYYQLIKGITTPLTASPSARAKFEEFVSNS